MYKLFVNLLQALIFVCSYCKKHKWLELLNGLYYNFILSTIDINKNEMHQSVTLLFSTEYCLL